MPYTGKVSVDGGPSAECSVTIDGDALEITGADARRVALVDIDDLHDDDYTMRIATAGGPAVALTHLGRGYGQLLAELREARDRALEAALLLRGVGLTDTFPGKVGGAPVELRVYEDLLVVVPQRGTMFGVPFSFIDAVTFDGTTYRVTVSLDDGDAVVLEHLAKRTEEFVAEMHRLMDALARRTEATLRALAPSAPSDALARAAQRMRDGRAAQQRTIDPALWAALEDAVAGTDALRASYEHLAARAPAGSVAFGVKAVARAAEGDAADASKTDRWFFVPLCRDGRPVDAVAQEVTSAEGHATYVFRLGVDPTDDGAVARAIARLNRALLLLNFRREPIMLPDEQMTGDDARYRVAMRSLPYLREARAAFLGRAIHNTSWAEQLDALIARA